MQASPPAAFCRDAIVSARSETRISLLVRTDRMKILQIVTQMEAAGAQRAAYLLHDSLRRRGHETELWFLYFKRPAYADKSGVRVLANQKPSLLGYFLLAFKLFAWIRASNPDVLITHTHYANILGQLVAVLAGVKRRLAVHHGILDRYPIIARYADWLWGTLGIYTTQIAVSDSVVESMSNYPDRYRRNVHRIYNGVVVDGETGLIGKRLACLSTGCQKILHVGRLSREKNHQVLFHSLQELPNAELILVGNGELREILEKEVRTMGLADRVCFLGEIDHADVRAVMSACDLFMFPSAYEAMPMALLEAMAAGMAIVASDIPANREVLQDAGILVPPDPQEFSHAAQRLLSDTCYARELARKAAGRARRFTVDAMVSGYENALNH